MGFAVCTNGSIDGILLVDIGLAETRSGGSIQNLDGDIRKKYSEKCDVNY